MKARFTAESAEGAEFRDRIPREGVEEGVEQREHTSAPPQPPIADYDPHDPSGCARDWQRLVDAQKALLSQ